MVVKYIIPALEKQESLVLITDTFVQPLPYAILPLLLFDQVYLVPLKRKSIAPHSKHNISQPIVRRACLNIASLLFLLSQS